MVTRLHWLKHAAAALLGLMFVNVGIQHWLDPEWFEPIVPDILGNARFLVLFSGVVEIGLGLALLLPSTRRNAGMAMAALLVVLYSANLNMWINDIPVGEIQLSTSGHILRALAQAAMIAIALWVGDWIPFTKADESTADSA